MLYLLLAVILLLALFLTIRYSVFIPATRGLPVLMYHKISEGHADGLKVPVDAFEEQLQYLKEKDYQTISCKELWAFFDEKKPLPANPVLLTFDDGYLNNLTLAYPLLQKYGMKATIFLPTAFLGKTNEWDGGGEPLLTVEQLKSMDHQCIELGLHSHTHQNYKHLSPQQIQQDLNACFQSFTEHGLPFASALAYPYGGRPKNKALLIEMKTIFSAAGLRMAFRIGNQVNPFFPSDFFELKRIDVRGTDSFWEFKTKLKKGRVKLF